MKKAKDVNISLLLVQDHATRMTFEEYMSQEWFKIVDEEKIKEK